MVSFESPAQGPNSEIYVITANLQNETSEIDLANSMELYMRNTNVPKVRIHLILNVQIYCKTQKL